MGVPDRQRFPTGFAGLQWMVTDDGSRTLWNERLDETYHSGCGAIAEAHHVYLLNSGVAQRLKAGLPTRVFEVGFGTGTNFWLTAAWAQRYNAPLFYSAVESDLLPLALFEQLRLPAASEGGEYEAGTRDTTTTAQHLAAQHILDRWCQDRSKADHPTIAGADEWRADENTMLHLRIAPLEAILPALNDTDFDAIYFDAFSPQTSPELWTVEVFGHMFRCLRPQGSLVTYCVKRTVQAGLSEVGFAISKTAGPPGGKREVLVARKP